MNLAVAHSHHAVVGLHRDVALMYVGNRATSSGSNDRILIILVLIVFDDHIAGICLDLGTFGMTIEERIGLERVIIVGERI